MSVGAAHWTGWDVASMLHASGADVGSSVLTNVASGAGIGVWWVWEQRIRMDATSGRPRRQSSYLPRTRFGEKQSTASGLSILYLT